MTYAEKEKRNAYERARYQRKKDEIKAYQKQYHTNRMINDPEYAERYRERSRTHKRRAMQDPARRAAERERSREWHKKHPRAYRKARLKAMYGITEDDFHRMMERQEDACSICGLFLLKPCIDHCHDTGRVRALLCSNCNSAIGKLQEDPMIIACALDYVERHKAISARFKVIAELVG